MFLIYKRFYLSIAVFGMAAGAYAAPIEFTDMVGNKVSLEKKTQRIVTLPMPGSSMIMSLDGGVAHLVGMHPEAGKMIQNSILGRIYPDAAHVRSDITQSGFAPNIETMLNLQPDLIWQWGHMGDELIAPLKKAGLPVAALVYGTEARTREWIRLMGISLGKEKQAAAQLQWRSEVEASIRKVTMQLATKDRPRVLYVSRFYSQYRAPGKATSFEFDIHMAGGINVSSAVGNVSTVNIEQILAWNPEVILLNNFEKKLTPEVIYSDPMLADIPAVKNRRIYKIPAGGYLWDPPSQESPLYWQWLSQILHPDKFHWPMRQLISQAYVQLYGYTPTQKDIDDVLHVKLNSKALGYGRFNK